MNTSKTILVVAPHADDEVLGVGGSVEKHIENGHEVHLLICGKRSNDSQEQIEQATRHYTSAQQMVFQDKSYYTVFNSILDSMERAYSRIRPDTVYIPNISDFNQDHRCIHEVCEITCRRFQENPPTCVLMYEIPSSTTQSFSNNFKCNFYEKLELKHVNAKIAIMETYENEMRKYPNPRSALGLMTYANFRGMECGEEYAEGFQILYKKA